MCVSAPGDEISLINLKLQVTKDLSLRGLDDCGASSNFVRRQSLEGRRLKTVEPRHHSDEVSGAPSHRRIDNR